MGPIRGVGSPAATALFPTHVHGQQGDDVRAVRILVEDPIAAGAQWGRGESGLASGGLQSLHPGDPCKLGLETQRPRRLGWLGGWQSGRTFYLRFFYF